MHSLEGFAAQHRLMLQGHLHPVLLEHVRNLSLEEVQALLGDVDGEDVATPLQQQVRHHPCPICRSNTLWSAFNPHQFIYQRSTCHVYSQDHHAGSALQAVQYLNLNGAENGIAYPVAQLVGASDAASRCCSQSSLPHISSMPLEDLVGTQQPLHA